MKVFNLTDVETPALKQRSLLNQHVVVHDKMAVPGGEVELTDEAFARVQSSLQDLIALGVLAVGELPADYKAAKLKAKPAEPQALPSPVQDESLAQEAVPAKTGRKDK